MGFFVLFIDLFLFLTRGRWVEEMLLLFLCTAFINFIDVFGDTRLRMSEFAVGAF